MLFRSWVQFFTDCLEALLDDDEAFRRQQREAALRQKRWLEYLSRLLPYRARAGRL
jgi:hypothetical protein